MSAPPDIEALLTSATAGQGAVKVWAYTSTTEINHLLEATSVQVDCRASSKERAEELAQMCRGVILALPGQKWDDGIVSKVSDVIGPQWLPDEDGAPRYVTRMTIHYREARA